MSLRSQFETLYSEARRMAIQHQEFSYHLLRRTYPISVRDFHKIAARLVVAGDIENLGNRKYRVLIDREGNQLPNSALTKLMKKPSVFVEPVAVRVPVVKKKKQQRRKKKEPAVATEVVAIAVETPQAKGTRRLREEYSLMMKKFRLRALAKAIGGETGDLLYEVVENLEELQVRRGVDSASISQ
jgi:hypothetical protein